MKTPQTTLPLISSSSVENATCEQMDALNNSVNLPSQTKSRLLVRPQKFVDQSLVVQRDTPIWVTTSTSTPRAHEVAANVSTITKGPSVWPPAGIKWYYSDSHVAIAHSDCREILPQLEPVDLVLTDPPYGVDFSYISHDDNPEEYLALVGPVFKWALEHAQITCSTIGIKNMYAFPPPKWVLAWNKPGSTRRNALGGFNIWEPIFIWGPARFVDDAITLPDCVNHSADLASLHPCPKPLKLYSWLVSRASSKGNVILDPFMGSGTTLRAAKDLGRKAIGIEIEEKYCEIAARRMSQGVLRFQERESGT